MRPLCPASGLAHHVLLHALEIVDALIGEGAQAGGAIAANRGAAEGEIAFERAVRVIPIFLLGS
jgi:hypothetical protein